MAIDLSFSSVLEALKSPKIPFAIFVAGCFLLFAPISFLEKIGLVELRQQFLPYVGGITLLAATLLITEGLALIFKWTKARRSARTNLKEMRKQLHALTDAEKHTLKPYISDGANTQQFAVNNGVVGGLVAKSILFRSSNTGYIHQFPYNLQPWARTYLKEHPELLD